MFYIDFQVHNVLNLIVNFFLNFKVLNAVMFYCNFTVTVAFYKHIFAVKVLDQHNHNFKAWF